MLRGEGQGMATYSRCLAKAMSDGTVGHHRFILTPQEQTSRVGFVGRKLSKKAKRELAEKMLASSKRHPELAAATVNAVRVAVESRA
jgi:hypothetical protein